MKKGLLLIVLGLAGGCGDNQQGGSADMAMPVLVPTNFTSINNEIFVPSCAKFSVCHSPDGAGLANMLDLKTDPYSALVGVAAYNIKALNEGKKRVDPCNPANSFLLTKLRMTTDTDIKTDYGAHMPQSNPNLPPQQIQAISDWISRGALQNEPSNVSGATCQLTGD